MLLFDTSHKYSWHLGPAASRRSFLLLRFVHVAGESMTGIWWKRVSFTCRAFWQLCSCQERSLGRGPCRSTSLKCVWDGKQKLRVPLVVTGKHQLVCFSSACIGTCPLEKDSQIWHLKVKTEKVFNSGQQFTANPLLCHYFIDRTLRNNAQSVC